MQRSDQKKKRIVLHDSLIYHPKTDCTYYLKSPGEAAYTVVNFVGDEATIKRCEFFDVATVSFRIDNADREFAANDDCIALSNESLFRGTAPQLPTFFYHPQHKFCRVISATFTFENIENKVNVSMQGYPLAHQPKAIENNEWAAACQKLAGKVPVTAGKYPIILTNGKPTFIELNKIYKQFLKFNSTQKLNWQYEHSTGHCHVRAHFVNALLDKYHINSLKVFKCWNAPDWKAFSTRNWDFHCAAMIVDSDNNIWVWDSWVGHNQELLTLDKWLFQHDEPTPTKVLIGNSVTLNIATNADTPYGSRFSMLSRSYTKSFQAVCGDATPSFMMLNRFGMFHKQSSALIKYEEPFLWRPRTSQ